MVFALLISMFQIVPAAALETHEDPEAAPLVYDGVAVLRKYSQAIDYVPSGNTAGLDILRGQAIDANVPPELRNTVEGFLSSCRTVAALVPELQTQLEDAKTKLAQYRIDDANQVLTSAKGSLNQAYAGLLVMDNAAEDTGRWWKVVPAENSSLSFAYNDVQEKLRQVRGLLDLLSNMYSSMMQTRASISLRSSNQSRLQPTGANISAGSSNQSIFQPTVLSLVVEPEKAWVGEKITLRGVLRADNTPLGGRIITLLLDNVPVASTLTGANGAYRKEIGVPFKYVPAMKVQAVFYPVGNDIGKYLGASSNAAVLNVLYYEAKLNAAQSTPANPGRDFLVTAVFNYGDVPPLDARDLSVYLDNTLLFAGTVGPAAFLRLPVAADTSPGTHNLFFYATPSGRYAPAAYEMPLEVSRLTPAIEADVPGIIFLPFSGEITGKVYSPAGPLKNAAVEISLGGWKAVAGTGEDGTFRTRLDTGLSLTLLGRQDIRISVRPLEPWHEAGFLDVGITVVNPINIAGILLILTVPVLLFSLNRKKPRPLPPQVVPVPVFSGGPPANRLETAKENAGTLLALYRGVLKVVQAATNLLLQPHQTLGEFTREAAPKLGAFAAYFREFTRIIERHLYSNRYSEDTDNRRAGELSRTLMTGIKNENS